MGTLLEALAAQQLYNDSSWTEGAPIGSNPPGVASVDLRGTTALAGLDLAGALLSDRDLTGADLSGTDISYGHLNSSILRGVQAHGFFAKKTEMIELDARGADFTGAKIIKCELWQARLDGACFDRALLQETPITNASLAGAVMIGASLRGVRMDGTDLSGADFTGTSGSVIRAGIAHPSWAGLDLAGALNARGADVHYEGEEQA